MCVCKCLDVFVRTEKLACHCTCRDQQSLMGRNGCPHEFDGIFVMLTTQSHLKFLDSVYFDFLCPQFS